MMPPGCGCIEGQESRRQQRHGDWARQASLVAREQESFQTADQADGEVGRSHRRNQEMR
jgi:hypothetical protein